MPVFLDLKIAQDPTLPGLSTETLPITTTVTGWPCCLTGKFFFKQWASMTAYMRLWLEWHFVYHSECFNSTSDGSIFNPTWSLPWSQGFFWDRLRNCCRNSFQTFQNLLDSDVLGVGPVASPLVSNWRGHLCWLACKCSHLGSSTRLSDMSEVVERVRPSSETGNRHPLLISFHAIWVFSMIFTNDWWLIRADSWKISGEDFLPWHIMVCQVIQFKALRSLGWRSQFIHPFGSQTQPRFRSQFEMSGGQFLLVSLFLARSLHISFPWIWDCSWFQAWLTPDLGSSRVHESPAKYRFISCCHSLSMEPERYYIIIYYRWCCG